MSVNLVGHIDSLAHKQYDLDQYILTTRELTMNPRDLYLSRVVALTVEMAEYANEVRAFKFWSGKECSREKALEEYIDALHFLLSLTNQTSEILSHFEKRLSLTRDYSKLFTALKEKELYTTNFAHNIMFMVCSRHITEMFLETLMTEELDADKLCSDLNRTWNSFQDLGELSGFTTDEVLAMYETKYKINIERQENGY